MHKFSRLIYILILAFFIPNVYASGGYDARFDINFEKHLLNFNIKLDKGYKIYSNDPGEVGFPTKIDIALSENLSRWQVIWPAPEKEYFHGTMYHYIYFGNVSIPVEITAEDPSRPVIIRGNITYAICADSCVPVSQDIDLDIGYIASSESTMIWILLAGIIGGAILNLMPCVLPVLMLKIFGVINNRGAGYRGHLIATICGIFSTFLLLGSLTFWLKSIGITFGLGANFQAPQFVIILCIIMVVFTSSILGRFEITLPNFITSGLSNMQFKGEYVGSFVSGIIATIFATPCTAPFLGTAISFAMTAEFAQIMLVFMSIALGFSLPYILLLIAPWMLNFLPKPGPWMLNFKKVLALAMIATILWLLSILQAQLGMRATFGVLMLLFLIKFVFEQENIRKPIRILLAAILFIGAMYLPTMASEEDQAKINEELQLWEPFDPVKLQQYINHGQIVIVDVTADWCMTCKYNKFILWNRSKTIKLLNDNHIITMRGDLTKPSHIIHEYLKANRVYGIPFDVVYGPKMKYGIALPTVVKYGDLVEVLKKVGME